MRYRKPEEEEVTRAEVKRRLQIMVEHGSTYGPDWLPHELRELRERICELEARKAAHARRPSRRTLRRVQRARARVGACGKQPARRGLLRTLDRLARRHPLVPIVA